MGNTGFTWRTPIWSTLPAIDTKGARESERQLTLKSKEIKILKHKCVKILRAMLNIRKTQVQFMVTLFNAI